MLVQRFGEKKDWAFDPFSVDLVQGGTISPLLTPIAVEYKISVEIWECQSWSVAEFVLRLFCMPLATLILCLLRVTIELFPFPVCP